MQGLPISLSFNLVILFSNGEQILYWMLMAPLLKSHNTMVVTDQEEDDIIGNIKLISLIAVLPSQGELLENGY